MGLGVPSLLETRIRTYSYRDGVLEKHKHEDGTHTCLYEGIREWIVNVVKDSD